MGSCDFASDRLVALVDGELAPDERDWVESHLAGCATCAGERREISDLRRLVSGALASPEVPTPSFAALLARLEAGDGEHAEPVAEPRATRGSASRVHGPRTAPVRRRGLRRPRAAWAIAAGATAALATMLAVIVSPAGRGLQGWLETPSTLHGVPGLPALAVTGKSAPRESAPRAGFRSSTSGQKAPGSARDGSTLAASEPSGDLQVPDELRRRPGLFLDMGVVRRLDKLKKMEAVYRSGDGQGRAG